MGLRTSSPGRGRVGIGLALSLALATDAAGAEPGRPNGFSLEPSSVAPEEILRGGPPRDGIPALDHPPHVPAAEASLTDDDRVLGVTAGGEARAYPLAILEWHELVNDTLAGRPILVSWCPLCGTGIAFDRRPGGETRRFGVSGLLYRSDLLLYDRETESLWSQISASAVAGPSLGQRVPGGPARAYPAPELVRAGGSAVERFAGREVRVAYDPETGVFSAQAPAGIEVIEGYWFAWATFHPETSVFSAGGPALPRPAAEASPP